MKNFGRVALSASELFATFLMLIPCQAFSDQSIPLKEYDLFGFRLDTSAASEVTGWISCSTEEISSGLNDLIWMGSGKAPGRELTPTRQPLERRAAWRIDNGENGCRSMHPYFNGIGFESFNSKTGEVVAYIGAFNEIDNSAEFGAADNAVTKARSLLQPKYNLINIIEFSGVCSFEKMGRIEQIWKKANLICDFGKSGQIVLTPR